MHLIPLPFGYIVTWALPSHTRTLSLPTLSIQRKRSLYFLLEGRKYCYQNLPASLFSIHVRLLICSCRTSLKSMFCPSSDLECSRAPLMTARVLPVTLHCHPKWGGGSCHVYSQLLRTSPPKCACTPLLSSLSHAVAHTSAVSLCTDNSSLL